jgi:hypothetical protein
MSFWAHLSHSREKACYVRPTSRTLSEKNNPQKFDRVDKDKHLDHKAGQISDKGD